MERHSGIRIELDPSVSQGELQNQLRELAHKIGSDLSALEPTQSKELLGTFVSELFVSVTEQANRRERRQRQAEGIAAAKKRGVKFGRQPAPLPDNFLEIHEAWRAKQLTLQEAADACNMPAGTFYAKAVRLEKETVPLV